MIGRVTTAACLVVALTAITLVPVSGQGEVSLTAGDGPVSDPILPLSSSSGAFMNTSVGCTTNCTDGSMKERFYFSNQERYVLWALTVVGSSLSLLGTSLITLSYIAFPSLRTFPYKLIVLLSISDFGGAISYLIPTGDMEVTYGPSGDILRPHPTTACVLQASLSQFFSIASFLWITVFSFNIYEVLVQKKSNVEAFERYYHLACWGVSALFLAINLGTHSFGPTLVWCWIDSAHNDLRIGTFYAPLIAIFLALFIFYLLIGKSLKGMGDEKQAAINSRLRQYLLVFFFVRVWSLANRFQNFLQPDHPIYFLYLMHSSMSTLQGFANAVVYGLNVRVRAHYSNMCCCCRRARASRPGGAHDRERLAAHQQHQQQHGHFRDVSAYDDDDSMIGGGLSYANLVKHHLQPQPISPLNTPSHGGMRYQTMHDDSQ